MVPVGGVFCDDCEVCAATAAGEGAGLAADTTDPGRSARRHRNQCARCGHPQRWHRPMADGHEAVVGAPPPTEVPDDASEPGSVIFGARETFVDQLRELTEMYRSGHLDDDEFAAAKAIVLRHGGVPTDQ